MYYAYVTGELEQASQVYELWAKSYPQDAIPPGNLGDIYGQLGQWEKALTETEEGQRLEPNVVGYSNLATDFLGKDVPFRRILLGEVKPPAPAASSMSALAAAASKAAIHETKEETREDKK
jgi:tetratricopeptide (TPR) repeat protein